MPFDLLHKYTLGVVHKRHQQEWGEGGQAEADIGGREVKQKWTSTFGSNFKYLISRTR